MYLFEAKVAYPYQKHTKLTLAIMEKYWITLSEKNKRAFSYIVIIIKRVLNTRGYTEYDHYTQTITVIGRCHNLSPDQKSWNAINIPVIWFDSNY